MKNILLLFCLTTLQATAQTKMELRPLLKSNIKWELINVSSDGQWLVTGQDRDLVIWDRNTQVQVASFPFCLPKKLPDSLQAWILEQDDWRDSEKYLAAAFLPDPELIAVWREWEYKLGNRQEHSTQRLRDSTGEHAVQELILWNWRENKIVDQIPFEIKDRRDIRKVKLAISADGLRIAGAVEMSGYTHQLIVYDWKARKEVFNKKIDGYKAPDVNPNVHDSTNDPYIQDIKFTDNSHELLIGWYENSYNGTNVQANAIDKWDVNTGQKVACFTPQPDWEHKSLLCFSPGKDGRYLLAAYWKKGDDTHNAVGIVRWNLKTGEIDPLPGVKNFYKTIHGDFPKHSLSNSYFFNDNRYFFSKWPGVYDVNSNTASTLYNCPPYNAIYYATSVVPIPGNNALFLTDQLKIVDLSLQINWDMQRLSLNPASPHENIFFGKDGLLVFKAEMGRSDMIWSLKNLRGTSSFIKDPASRAGQISVTSTGEFKDETGHYHRDSAFFINPKTGIKNTAMESPGFFRDLWYYSADGRWSIKQESYNSILHEINWKENKYIVNNKFGNEDRWNAYIVFCFSPQHNYFYGIANRSKRERETPVWRLLKISLPDLQVVDSMDLSKERWDWAKAGGGIRDKTKIICNANDLFLAFSNNYGDLFIYDVRKKQITAPFNKTIQDFKFSPDGKQLAIAHYNQIEIYDLPDLTLRHTLVNRERIKAFDINPEATRLAMLAADGFTVSIWDWQNATLIATLIANPKKEPGQYCYFTPDYYYAVNKGHESDFGFQQGDQYYSYDQLDFFYNRPDIIMQRLGFADPGYIARLESAYQTRIKKSGLTKALENTIWQVPEVVVNDGAPLPARTKERKMQIKVAASDQAFPLALIRISINEVPLLGARGKDISKAGKPSFSGVFEIELVQRINVIEVQAVNSQGIASFKQRFTVVLDGDLPAPDLHLVCIGVSKYKDAGMNLQYADKDAADVGRLFKDRSGAFRNLFHYEYLNEAVTKEKIAALRSKLAQSKPEDMVIVFAAGHGLLDHKLDFYFASHDVDFSNPQARGIPFDLLESLLTDIPARQKVLLLDACFSGELDESAARKETTANTANNGKVVFRSVHTKVLNPEGADNSFDLMKDLFVDLRRGSGAVIISAAGGAEAAMEGGGLANGVFTYTLKEALKVKIEDKKNAVTITDVQKYVLSEVSRRTGGVQQPTSRVEYLYNDFVVWKFINPYEKKHTTPNDIKNAVLNGADVNQILCDKSRYGDTECPTLLMKVVNDYDDVELVHWLVSRGADPFEKGTIRLDNEGYYGNLLSIAAAQGKVELLKYFIETCKIPVDDKELDLKTWTETGWTGLQWAATNGQFNAAQYLLEKGAKPDERIDETADTPLMLAAAKGHIALAKLLVKYGANCHLKKQDGRSTFHLAAAAGQLECLKYLATIDTTREEAMTDGHAKLMSAANISDDPELFRLLVSNGANPARKGTIYLYDQFGQKTDGYYGNLLGLAAAQGKMALLKYFIEECKLPVEDKEYDPDKKTDAGWTGLQWAANNGQIEAARYLLDKGAKPDERTDETVDTPFMLAVSQGHVDLAKVLVQYGARWQAKKSDGNTALHLAAMYQQLDALKWLLSLGADTKTVNKEGKTPLQVAGYTGQCYYYLLNLK